MHILIAERLKPFIHSLKACAILPGTPFKVEIYPALILVYNLLKSEPELVSTIETTIAGPVEKFTVQLNLEKGFLLVFGEEKQGYFRYRLSASAQGDELFIAVEKEGSSPLKFTQVEGKLSLTMGQNPAAFSRHERLSLGNHKAQDFTLIKRRQDLKEILPIWLKTAGFYAPQKVTDEGTGQLLEMAEVLIEKGNPNDYLAPLKTLFNAAFYGMMVPSLTDHTHQGLNLPKVTKAASPLFLLTEGANLIRSLFVRFEKNVLKVLPKLPKEFHSGRFLHVELLRVGFLDLEWSKKAVQRMILSCTDSCTLDIQFPKEIKRFRLEGEWVKVNTPLKLEKGKTYFFDRFEK